MLYICLCGFPPFSEELKSEDFPYTLSGQIKAGRFDYPSPFWDSVGDPVLDLIDAMIEVDMEKRYPAKQCMAHPWMKNLAGPLRSDPDSGFRQALRDLQITRVNTPTADGGTPS